VDFERQQRSGVTIALSLTIHAPALALLAAVFGLLAAGMHISDLLDD
jgi:hypothetical protein